MRKIVVLILISVIGSFVFSGCMENTGNENDELVNGNDTTNDDVVDENQTILLAHLDSHFGFMHPEHFSEMTELSVYWQRPHPGPFVWHSIEKVPNDRNWKEVDDVVLESQNHEVNIIATGNWCNIPVTSCKMDFLPPHRYSPQR